MNKFIDVHCHLNDEMFDGKVEQIVNNFNNDGVKAVIVAGYDLESSKKAIEFCNKYENVYAAIGLHPEDCESWNEEFEQFLLENLNNKKVVAVGEIGLDYHYTSDNKEQQKKVLIKQMEIANQFNLPIVIHVRDSIGDLISVMQENKHLLNNSGIIHCFNQSYESYELLKKLGFKFSFGGVVTFKNGRNIHELIKKVDENDILLETDSPYLTPEPFRGQCINEPKFIKYVVQKIAELRNVDENVIVENANKNTKIVFKKLSGENE